MKNKNSIYKIVTVGLLGALVFVSNYLSFPIPVPVGDISRIHLGNAFCLLGGLCDGPDRRRSGFRYRRDALRPDEPGVHRFGSVYVCI